MRNTSMIKKKMNTGRTAARCIGNAGAVFPAKEAGCHRTKKRALMLASVASMLDLFNADNIRILIELGCQVDVAANFDSGSITSQKRVDEYKQELLDRGIGVYHIPIPRDLSMTAAMKKSYKDIKRLINTNAYDIVHCHSPIGGVLCRLACIGARRRGTKVIYTAHGFHFYKGAGCKAWMIYYPAERFCSLFTDVLIAINREDYQAAKKFYAKKTVYVPGIGIHVNEIKDAVVDRKEKRSEFGYTDTDFVFMSTGQLSVRKNHEAVIRALKKLNNPSVRYLIVGFGELEDKLKQLVKQLGLESSVTFAGYRSDVKELLHIADAFIFPSIQEGLPAALMEAMAAGLPVICSRIRGNTDLVKDNKGGYLADCYNTDAFARAMERIAETDHSRMGIVNQKVIMNYDSKKINKKMKKIYSELEI